MRKLSIHKDVRKFIDDLDAKQYRQVVRRIIGLMEDPNPVDSRSLKGYESMRRVDQGEFRIIYEFDDETVSVYVAGRRNDDAAYRKLERL